MAAANSASNGRLADLRLIEGSELEFQDLDLIARLWQLQRRRHADNIAVAGQCTDQR
jgi:hypothetical protein